MRALSVGVHATSSRANVRYSPPDISVIIPTNRRPEILAPCLRALLQQDFAKERFEVLVLNDGGKHDLSALATTLSRDGLRVRIITVPQGGPGPARNRGAELAQGALLVFTDDDCLPEPGWLSAFSLANAAHPEALLGGPVSNLLTHRPASEASQVLVSFLYDWYNQNPLDARFFTSNNIAARRESFQRHGGFDTRFTLSAGEDRDLCARWREQGGQLVFVPHARIGHAHDLSIRKFWLQHFKYGRGAAMYWTARPGSGAAIRVEPFRFYSQLLRYPLTHTPWPRAIRSAGLIALSQIANAVGFLVTARRWPRLTRSAPIADE